MTLDELRTERLPARVFGGEQRLVVTNGTLHGVPAVFLEPIPDEVAREPGTQEQTPDGETRLTPGSVAIVLGHPGTTEVLFDFLTRAAATAGHPVPTARAASDRAVRVAAAIRSVPPTLPRILVRFGQLLERIAVEVEKLGGETFQPRCQAWLDRVTEGDPTDIDERLCRFYEEATELVQSLGLPRGAAHALVDYTFERPVGELAQEFGGMLTTAAVLAEHTGHDLLACGEAELARVWDPAVIEKIRGKRSRRHGRGPLPGTTEADLVPGR